MVGCFWYIFLVELAQSYPLKVIGKFNFVNQYGWWCQNDPFCGEYRHLSINVDDWQNWLKWHFHPKVYFSMFFILC